MAKCSGSDNRHDNGFWLASGRAGAPVQMSRVASSLALHCFMPTGCHCCDLLSGSTLTFDASQTRYQPEGATGPTILLLGIGVTGCHGDPK